MNDESEYLWELRKFTSWIRGEVNKEDLQEISYKLNKVLESEEIIDCNKFSMLFDLINLIKTKNIDIEYQKSFRDFLCNEKVALEILKQIELLFFLPYEEFEFFCENNDEKIRKALKEKYIFYKSIQPMDDEDFWFEFPTGVIVDDENNYFLNIPPIKNIDGKNTIDLRQVLKQKNANKLIYYFYKKFRDDIKFCYLNQEDETSFFLIMSDEQLLELFFLEFPKKSYASSLIFTEICKRDDLLFEIIKKYQQEEIIEKIIRLNEVVNITDNNVFNAVLDHFNEIIPYDDDSDVFSEGFLSHLSYSRKIPKKIRINTKEYQDTFEVYRKKFPNIKTEDGIKTLDLVFNRVIDKDMYKSLSITNETELYFFFKTNIIDNSLKVSLDEIKKVNAKQFLRLCEKRDLIASKKPRSMCEFISDDLIDYSFYNTLSNSSLIKVLNYCGFDFINSTLDDYPDNKIIFNEFDSVIEFLNSMKDIDSRKSFLIFLKDFSRYTKNNDKDIPLKKILIYYDYLLKNSNNHKKITFDNVMKIILSDVILFPNTEKLKPYLKQLDFVKKGDIRLEKLKGRDLYQKYRFRTDSTIPDLSGTYNELNYQLVDMHDLRIISNGIGNYIVNNNHVSSCLTPNGKASSCLEHGALNPNGRFFKIERDGKILAYSWVWRRGNVLCFDNIELTEEYEKINDREKVVFDIYKEVASKFIDMTRNSLYPIDLVLLGRNKIDVDNSYISNLEDINKYYSKKIEPTSNVPLYLVDSEKKLILEGDPSNINLDDVESLYHYERKPIKCFDDYSFDEVNEVINSIYFDYCLKEQLPTKRLNNDFITGYFNEDWFMGIREDGSREVYNSCDLKSTLQEIKDFCKMEVSVKEKINVISLGKYNDFKYLIDKNNYEINTGELEDYINYLKGLTKEEREDVYFHSPHYIDCFLKILMDKAITSEKFGKRNDLINYVCVAKVGSETFYFYSKDLGFVFPDNLLAYQCNNEIDKEKINSLLDKSAFSLDGHNGEYRVKDYIPLSKASGVYLPANDIITLGMVPTIVDEMDYDLPLVLTDNFQEIDKSIVKKMVKLK